MLRTEVNVLSDGSRVTGWANDEGIPVDNVESPKCDHDWVMNKAGRCVRSCTKCGEEETDLERKESETDDD
jgi:hypothetical protein